MIGISRQKTYALYKGDKFIDLGSKEYLANKLGVKTSFIEFLHSPANKRRMLKNKNKSESDRMLVITIEEDEEE